MAGLYEPWSGSIRFDGKLRGELPPTVIQASVAMVDQDISLFEGSVRDNLTLWDRSIPDAAVIQAAKDAAIHDDIAARPGGYDSKVEESGRNFSGGQRQRLSIARAVLKDAPIILLDEPTSALDSETERIIQTALQSLTRGRTTIVIAHRLATVARADVIHVLDLGEVVESGSQAELLRRDGRYARLHRLQFEHLEAG